MDHERKYDNFLPTLNSIFNKARYFGISSYGFTLAFCWSVLLLLVFIFIECRALFRVIRVLCGLTNEFFEKGGIVHRVSGSIFYGNAMLSLIFSSIFLHSWKKIIASHWLNMEINSGLEFPSDVRIKKKAIFVTGFVVIFACAEHVMSMMSAMDLNCSLREMFYKYIMASHGFLIGENDYHLWVAVALFIFSKIATVLWNFQDLIIILISMGLASRYHRLNLYVKNLVLFEKSNGQKFGTELYLQNLVWRRLREAYVRQASLVRMVDTKLGGLVLLSNFGNLYFICLQLFAGIHKDRGSVINRCYYFMSLSWLILRSCSVVLSASDVHTASQAALRLLHTCPSTSYNIEIKRLQYQLRHDHVALTGMGFFSLRREMLLEVAAAILKYELVLIQYDT